MSMFKNAMAGAAALGMVLASTAASAETVRASAALPGVVSVKKNKIARTSAPTSRESNAVVTYSTYALALTAAAAAGVATWLITRNNDGSASFDSPAG